MDDLTQSVQANLHLVLILNYSAYTMKSSSEVRIKLYCLPYKQCLHPSNSALCLFRCGFVYISHHHKTSIYEMYNIALYLNRCMFDYFITYLNKCKYLLSHLLKVINIYSIQQTAPIKAIRL